MLIAWTKEGGHRQQWRKLKNCVMGTSSRLEAGLDKGDERP